MRVVESAAHHRRLHQRSRPPAICWPFLAYLGTAQRSYLLPMLPSVCFETGRFTLTQSSWTILRYRSRKWMSGQAAFALVVRRNRGQFGRAMRTVAMLGQSLPPSAGKPPLSLDTPIMDVPEFPTAATSIIASARNTRAGQMGSN